MVYQEVHINRKEVNSIEFANNEIYIPVKPGEEHTFEISIINHGTPTHVHLSTSTNLRDKIVFLRDNPYVQREVKIPAVVHLPANSEKLYQGEIYVSTGYGSKKESFIAKLGVEMEEEKIPQVIVDESLSRYERPFEKASAIEKFKFKFPARPKVNLVLTLILISLGAAFVLMMLSFWRAIDRFYGSIAASAIIVYLLLYIAGRVK